MTGTAIHSMAVFPAPTALRFLMLQRAAGSGHFQSQEARPRSCAPVLFRGVKPQTSAQSKSGWLLFVMHGTNEPDDRLRLLPVLPTVGPTPARRV